MSKRSNLIGWSIPISKPHTFLGLLCISFFFYIMISKLTTSTNVYFFLSILNSRVGLPLHSHYLLVLQLHLVDALSTSRNQFAQQINHSCQLHQDSQLVCLESLDNLKVLCYSYHFSKFLVKVLIISLLLVYLTVSRKILDN